MTVALAGGAEAEPTVATVVAGGTTQKAQVMVVGAVTVIGVAAQALLLQEVMVTTVASGQ